MGGLEDCESSLTRPKTKKMIAEEYSARHFSTTRQASKEGGMDNTSWRPGTEDPADGLTKERRNMAPLPQLLESGHFNPNPLQPLRGATQKQEGYSCNYRN